nr:VOC family protein [Brevibacterium yomogidense]
MQSFGTAGAVHWAELFTTDPRVRDFYTSVFEWVLPSLTDGEDQRYWAIDRDDSRIGGILDASQVAVPAHWEAHVHVDDVDGLVDRVRELGGDVLAPPHDSHHGRVGRFIDAQNAAFTLVTPFTPTD